MVRDHLCEFLDKLWHTHILLFSMNDAIEFVDVNTAFCALTGYSQQELIGTPLDTIFKCEGSHLSPAREGFHRAPDPLQSTVWTVTQKNKSQLNMHFFAEWLIKAKDSVYKLIMLIPSSELTDVSEQLRLFVKCQDDNTIIHHLEPISIALSMPHQASSSKRMNDKTSVLRHLNLLKRHSAWDSRRFA